MKNQFLLLTILSLLSLTSCYFQPDGENFVELNSTGTVPDVDVDLNLATDTIYVTKNEWLNFSYVSNSDKVVGAQFIINGQETSVFEDKTGSIQLSWYFTNTDSGAYPMIMKLFTHSRTGSIADKLGAEGFLLERQWTIVIVDSYHLGSDILKTEFINGSLEIDWRMFKGMDFSNYKLYKEMPYLQNSRVLVTTILSQDQTSFVDNTYHGEESRYYIVVNDQFYGSDMTVKGPLPELSATNTSTGDILLKWSIPPYSKNLKGYRVSFRDDTGQFQTLLDINSVTTDSCIVPSPRFAYYYELFLTPIALSDNLYEDWLLQQVLSTKAIAAYGLETPKYNTALGGLAPMTYLYNYNRISVFDNQQFSVTKEFTSDIGYSSFDVSSNNRYLVAKLNSLGQVQLYDLQNASKSKLLSLSSIYPVMGHIASVSDKGTGVIINDQTAVLFDYLNETELGEIQLKYNGLYSNKISASGNFFLCETYNGYEYFEFRNNQIERLPGFNDNNDYVLHADYLPGANEKLVRAFSNRVEVLNCNTWQIEKQWTFASPIVEAYNLDMSSGKLFLRVENNLILFDPNNGTSKEVMKTGNTNYVNKWNLFYNNGQILWGEGKGVILNPVN